MPMPPYSHHRLCNMKPRSTACISATYLSLQLKTKKKKKPNRCDGEKSIIKKIYIIYYNIDRNIRLLIHILWAVYILDTDLSPHLRAHRCETSHNICISMNNMNVINVLHNYIGIRGYNGFYLS